MSNALGIKIKYEGKRRGRAVAIDLARLVIAEAAQKIPLVLSMEEVTVGRKGRKGTTRG